jgi:hypothetical protein
MLPSMALSPRDPLSPGLRRPSRAGERTLLEMSAPDPRAEQLAAQLATLPHPAVCPRCGAGAVRPILYGWVVGGWQADAARRGLLLLGGCRLGPESPGWVCAACHQAGGRALDQLPPELLAAIDTNERTQRG